MSVESTALKEAASPESMPNFGFAFDNANYSDRILRIEVVVQGVPGPKANYDDDLDDWPRYRKRRRGDPINNAEESTTNGLVEELRVAADITNKSSISSMEGAEKFLSMNSSAVRDKNNRVKNIHVSSPILAAKSPYFYKLFSNGMRESEQREITLQIHDSEEEAFMDLLRFIYWNTLPRTTTTALLDVLLAADKYEVALCMIYCTKILRTLPMTLESALLYLNLPPNVLMAETVVPLADAAKQYLAERYKDIVKFYNEVLELPLAGIEAVLSSDNLQLPSEYAVYNFMLKWARKHYPNLDERREIIKTNLLRFIRFPSMSTRKLKKVLTCNDIKPKVANSVVLDALFSKVQRSVFTKAPMARFIERTYISHPVKVKVKVVQFESPRQSCIVYLDLKREECVQLLTNVRICSRTFYLGEQRFYLYGRRSMDQENTAHCFGLYLGMRENGIVSIPVDFAFASRTKPTLEFVHKWGGHSKFTGEMPFGCRNLFGVTWDAFLAEDSPYFINGILHLRAQLTVKE